MMANFLSNLVGDVFGKITNFFGPGGNPFLQSAVIYTFGTVLNSLTQKEPKVYRSADDRLKDHLLESYKKIRERRQYAATLASAITGLPTDTYLRGRGTYDAVAEIRKSGQHPDFEMFPIEGEVSDNKVKAKGGREIAGPMDEKITKTGKGPSTPEEQAQLTEEITTQAESKLPSDAADFEAWKATQPRKKGYTPLGYNDWVKLGKPK